MGTLPSPTYVPLCFCCEPESRETGKHNDMASSSTGQSTGVNPGVLSEVRGHLSTRLAKGENPTLMQEIPAFPSQGQVRAFSWLVNLVNAITLDIRSFIGLWNLNVMVVLVKNMKDMWWGFDALGALVERWHPHTHMFVFQGFEASVLLEERSQSTGGFTPFLQIWGYTRFPMGRGTLVEGRQMMVPLITRWEVAPDPRVTDRRVGDVRVVLDHYPHEQEVELTRLRTEVRTLGSVNVEGGVSESSSEPRPRGELVGIAGERGPRRPPAGCPGPGTGSGPGARGAGSRGWG
ncbi:hypothetical protein Taro_048989 [Colocasia esculenta]|uniref:Aminotransferase-like plant mobile domain-containing protein n=1 Tax=Colocasia esculenta TaxID=4460 RepID=A0A843X9K0_COLES|nr:hypothetical protein [Colocasia esculenta]